MVMGCPLHGGLKIHSSDLCMSTHVNLTHVNFTFKKLYKINNQHGVVVGGGGAGES